MRPRHCRLWLLNATTPHELRCLLSDNVSFNSGQIVCGIHNRVGFVSNNHGDRGGVRGLKDKTFSGLRGLVGENRILRTRA